MSDKPKLRHRTIHSGTEKKAAGELKIKLEFAAKEKRLRTQSEREVVRYTRRDDEEKKERLSSEKLQEESRGLPSADQNARRALAKRNRQEYRYKRKLLEQESGNKDYLPLSTDTYAEPLVATTDAFELPVSKDAGISDSAADQSEIPKGNLRLQQKNTLMQRHSDLLEGSNSKALNEEGAEKNSKRGKQRFTNFTAPPDIFRLEGDGKQYYSETLPSKLIIEKAGEKDGQYSKEKLSSKEAPRSEEKYRANKQAYIDREKIQEHPKTYGLSTEGEKDDRDSPLEVGRSKLEDRQGNPAKLYDSTNKDYENWWEAPNNKSSSMAVMQNPREKIQSNSSLLEETFVTEKDFSYEKKSTQDPSSYITAKSGQPKTPIEKIPSEPTPSKQKNTKVALGKKELLKMVVYNAADRLVSHSEDDSSELQDVRSAARGADSANKLRRKAVTTAHLVTTPKRKELETAPSGEKLITGNKNISSDKLYFSPGESGDKHSQAKKAELLKKQNQALQKRRVKQQYAQAFKEAARGNFTPISHHPIAFTKKSGGIVRAASKKYFLPIILIGFAIIVILSVAVSCSVALSQGVAYILTTTYLASDLDITEASLIYSELETDLDIYINNIESIYPGYDEYEINAGMFGPYEPVGGRFNFSPYEFMAYLTVLYGEFDADDIRGELNSLFERQHSLSITPRTETRTNQYTNDDGETVTETYDVNILVVTVSFTAFADLARENMTEEQQEDYKNYVESTGNRQFFTSPFDDVDWYYFVTSPFGWRINPMGEDKQLHKGVDIARPEGTPILAVQNGRVITHGYNDDYGYRVVIESEHGWKSLYAHCSTLSVRLGQEVKEGDEIGKVGSTGNSTGTHLHLEIMADGEHLNPYYFVERKSLGGGSDGVGGFLPSEGDVGSPVEPQYINSITSDYGMRDGGMHYGIDFQWGREATYGAPIYATMDGVVSYANYDVRPYRGYGKCVVIDHGGGISTLYGHQSEFLVSVGEAVVKGQQIGRIGNTGDVRPKPNNSAPLAGTHLHFEYRVNGRPINPHILLNQVRN